MPMHHSRQKQYFLRKKYEEYEAKATVVFQFEIFSVGQAFLPLKKSQTRMSDPLKRIFIFT